MLGTFDWVAVQCTPGVKPGPLAIIVGPALKGFVAGVLMGAFVRKVLSSDGGRRCGASWWDLYPGVRHNSTQPVRRRNSRDRAARKVSV
jgi:hypothetical protein